jgi:hypothetical protein
MWNLRVPSSTPLTRPANPGIAPDHWGLKEDEILPRARILAVATYFITLVNPRTGEPPLCFNEACSELILQNGTRYDRKPVSALINFLDNRGGAENGPDSVNHDRFPLTSLSRSA